MTSIALKDLRRAVLRLVTLASAYERGDLDEEDHLALAAVVGELARGRERVEERVTQAEAAFLVERVVRPAYQDFRKQPGAGTGELKALLISRAEAASLEWTEEALEALEVSQEQLTELRGAKEAACHMVGKLVGRKWRTLFNWCADPAPLPIRIRGMRSMDAANLMLYALSCIASVARWDRSPKVAERIEKVIEFVLSMGRKVPLAPPPPPPPAPSRT